MREGQRAYITAYIDNSNSKSLAISTIEDYVTMGQRRESREEEISRDK